MKQSSESTVETARLGILEVAERLFRQIGFEKTAVADIARELRMSSANIYRFFSSKGAINEAVARRLLSEVEDVVEEIAKRSAPAGARLRASIASIEKNNAQRFLDNRKLHELVETAFNENWPIVREHVEKLNGALAAIIAQGNEAGDFHVEDCDLAAMLVRSACLRFCHPRLMVECAQDPEPTLDQMIDFCLVALAQGMPATKPMPEIVPVRRPRKGTKQ
jgi:AcrR family transcriptional regulator